MRLVLSHRLGQRLEVGLPGVVALGEAFQVTLDEGHALAEFELLVFGHVYFPFGTSARPASNSDSSPRWMKLMPSSPSSPSFAQPRPDNGVPSDPSVPSRDHSTQGSPSRRPSRSSMIPRT